MKSNISGFPELLPNEQMAFNKIINTIKERFELYGFVPMDTPVVERIDTLLAKGSDNEIYGIYRLADEANKKDLGLRFDLTVPLARYIADNLGQLIFPYKRYQIAPVWRGERPQYGRYRQFYQCDIDIVGDGDLSIEHDAEIISLVTDVLSSLGIPSFHTKLSNRKLLCGFLRTIIDQEKIDNVIKLIDKIDKTSFEEFCSNLEQNKIPNECITKLKSFLDTEKRGNTSEIIKWLNDLNFNEEYNQGVVELSSALQILKKLGVEDSKIKISTKLARGLSYYTGNIFETVFNDFKDIGSISGGGRYDNLTETLSAKKFPGVGATIGISRLVFSLMENGLLETNKLSTADVLVTVQNREFIGNYMRISNKLRSIGIKTETYLQDKSLGVQLSYANRKGFRFVVIANEMELLESKIIIRDLQTKEQKIVFIEHLEKEVFKDMLPANFF